MSLGESEGNTWKGDDSRSLVSFLFPSGDSQVAELLQLWGLMTEQDQAEVLALAHRLS
jgi:hypothetical protein